MKQAIQVQSKIIEDGIRITVNGQTFPIIYPRHVWQAYPNQLKEVLRDNIALSSTYFIPQILNNENINYDSSRPASEAFLFKNGIYDMSNSAIMDKQSSISYIKKFINTVATFQDNQIRLPPQDYGKISKKQRIIIPFTFGKDSLLTVAVAQEIGLDPHLVFFIEPAHTNEYRHKEKLMNAFYQQTGMEIQTVQYEPGQMRYGHIWNKQTELGWGLQTTDYALLSLPFLDYWQAQYIGLGNEYSCREAGMNDEGLLTHWSAYDQHPDWTPQQSLLVTMVGGRKVEVISLVEPLHELAEMSILHHRYSLLGRFQTSCSALDQKAKKNRWCQNCEKCGSIYAFMKGLDINVTQVGFTEDLFDKEHTALFDNLFLTNNKDIYYGVQEEVFLAMYLAAQRGSEGEVIRLFKKNILPSYKNVINKYFDEFFKIYPTKNLTPNLEKKVFQIYNQERNKLLSELKRLV